MDRGEGAPHVLIKWVTKRVASLKLEAPLQMVADWGQVRFIVIKGQRLDDILE